ncbi:MAG: hypothetical protein Q7S68_02445 [Deltaproteobacteria bacterium]|nr:hypothetical protein [Deltaproteobacteria bacterium]
MATEQKATLGYPLVEKLIDSEDFNEVNKAFQSAYKDLESLSKVKGGLRKSGEAKKAMVALEKASELLKELLKIKYRLQEEVAKQAATTGKKKK